MDELNDKLPREMKWSIMLFIGLKTLPTFFVIDKTWFGISENDNFWKEVSLRDPDFRKELKKTNNKIAKSYRETYKRFLDIRFGLKRTKTYTWEESKALGAKTIKVVFLGSSGSGKSSTFIRFADNTFSDVHLSTIGADFKMRYFVDLHSSESDDKKDKKVVQYQMWDTAGEERFRQVTSAYYRGGNGFIFCFDITSLSSFRDLTSYWNDKENFKDTKLRTTSIVCGCKCDLHEKREVTVEQAKEFCESRKVRYFETSSKENINVEKSLNYLLRQCLLNLPKRDEKGKDAKEKDITEWSIFKRCSLM